MFDHRHYVPVLKGKDGEYRALGLLGDAAKARLTPLVEVLLTPAAAANLAKGFRKLGTDFERNWGVDRPIFVDMRFLSEERTVRGAYRALAGKGIHIVPVTELAREPWYQQVVAEIAVGDATGACVRLRDEDIEDANGLVGRLETFLGQSGLDRHAVDVVIDLGSISPAQLARMTALSRANLQILPHQGDRRTLTIASTAFPQSMAGLQQYAVNSRPRADWGLWKGLRAVGPALDRRPTFGDYAIQHPDLVEYDPKTMTMSPNVRYTAADVWLILRGRSVKSHGWKQVHGLTQTLVQQPEFRGQQHCAGCEHIARTAQSGKSPWNAGIWRRYGTVHHLTTVTEQLANLHGV